MPHRNRGATRRIENEGQAQLVPTTLGTRLNQLERQVEEQAREIKHTKTACAVSFVIETTQTQRLILHVNEFQHSIQSHPNSHALTQLATNLVGALRAHCNALIPLASGFYRPHTSSVAPVELGHASGHVATHGVHYISSLHHYANTISMGIPLLGLAATVYDVWHEHHAIHEAETAVRKLAIYSDNQREALYRYVVIGTILTFANSLEGKYFQPYQAKMVFEIFSCLPKIHVCESIDDLAKNWRESTIHAIQQSGVMMFSSAQPVKFTTYKKEQLSIAWKVQQIFLNTDETMVQKYLTLPIITSFLDDSHRRIYEKVLKPYDVRANSNAFESFFHGFSAEQLKLVKKYQSYFIRALNVIQKELTPLKVLDETSYTLQLNLINTCLYANLNAMGLAMKWHYAQGLFSELAAISPDLTCTPCPLGEASNGTLRIVSVEGQLAEAKVQRDEARADAKKSAAAAEQAAASAKLAMDAVLRMQGQPPIPASTAAQGIFAHATQLPAVGYRLSQLPVDNTLMLEAKILYVTNMQALQAGATKQLKYAVMNASNQRADGVLTLGEINKQGGHTFEKPITFNQLEPCLKTMLKLITDKHDALPVAQAAQARAGV